MLFCLLFYAKRKMYCIYTTAAGNILAGILKPPTICRLLSLLPGYVYVHGHHTLDLQIKTTDNRENYPGHMSDIYLRRFIIVLSGLFSLLLFKTEPFFLAEYFVLNVIAF